MKDKITKYERMLELMKEMGADCGGNGIISDTLPVLNFPGFSKEVLDMAKFQLSFTDDTLLFDKDGELIAIGNNGVGPFVDVFDPRK